MATALEANQGKYYHLDEISDAILWGIIETGGYDKDYDRIQRIWDLMAGFFTIDTRFVTPIPNLYRTEKGFCLYTTGKVLQYLATPFGKISIIMELDSTTMEILIKRFRLELTSNVELHPNDFESLEFNKEASRNFYLEGATTAERQGASEDENFRTELTLSKTNSSSCLGISIYTLHNIDEESLPDVMWPQPDCTRVDSQLIRMWGLLANASQS